MRQFWQSKSIRRADSHLPTSRHLILASKPQSQREIRRTATLLISAVPTPSGRLRIARSQPSLPKRSFNS